MHPLRSVGARLSLALAVVVAAALAIVYVGLVPTLEHRLVNGKLDQLRHFAAAVPAQYATSEVPLDDLATSVAATIDGQVVVFRVLAATPLTLTPFATSLQGRNAAGLENDPVAVRAATSGTLASGTVDHGDESFAEAAVPTPDGNVVLLSSPLHDTLADVALIRRRIVWAGLVALAAAGVLGFGAAGAFARRLKRLEQAAERIASGDFSQPVVDPGEDEVGQLARAFERMRGRLARLDDARSAFIANASHELRTPIFSLGGFLELLEDEDLDERTRAEFLATAREQVARLAALATDLLDLSQLDAGQLRIEAEPVELAAVAEALVGELQPLAAAGGHPLEAVVESDAVVSADPERVLQIGRALVANALRHTPPGTPVRVRVAAAELAVEDEGPGIPEAERERVFERFTRLDGGRASGSGLGLAIARELAEAMGGSVALACPPGRTVFSLRLPSAGAAPFSRGNAPAPAR